PALRCWANPLACGALYRNTLSICQARQKCMVPYEISGVRLLTLPGRIRFARVPRENLVGQIIAGYSLQSEVGEGGTSAVFRAHHADHGTVAVKVLREKLRQDRTAVARFLREARY